MTLAQKCGDPFVLMSSFQFILKHWLFLQGEFFPLESTNPRITTSLPFLPSSI